MNLPTKQLSPDDNVIVKKGSPIFELNNNKVSSYKLNRNKTIDIDFVYVTFDKRVAWMENETWYETDIENTILVEG